MNIVSKSWAHRLIGATVEEPCFGIDVEKDGVRALCVDCRMGFRRSELKMTLKEARHAGLADEVYRQEVEESEAKFPWSLRQAIEQVFELELQATEGIWLVESDDDRRRVSRETRPVLEANSKLLELYKKVTGFEFRTRRDVLGEMYTLEGGR